MKHITLDERPLVSVVVPAYNAQNFIPSTLNSLITQSFKNFELIVVNDGSTDKTEDVVKHFYFDRRLRYFKKPNGGTGSALNLGHENARGKFVTWCSADNVYFPSFLEVFVRTFEQIEKMGKAEEIQFLYSDFLYINEQGHPIGHNIIHKPIPKQDLVNGYDYGISFMYTKRLWDKTGPYWNRMCEDYEWCVRAMQHTDHGLVNAMLAGFRIHGGQLTGSKAEEEKAINAHCRQMAKELFKL